jgi:hypothetical protein
VIENPNPDMEVVIEPYGLYINAFCFLEEVEKKIAARFGKLEYILWHSTHGNENTLSSDYASLIGATRVDVSDLRKITN